ncbi:hypothetical protein ABZW30_03690 [Kitasatospora sp. NPDC004669]|uniref:hypothetical protein n=1 Tax=Kitasatospora sp. NPDC004669 TaxID=3154555 RepID=UPI0033BB5760
MAPRCDARGAAAFLPSAPSTDEVGNLDGAPVRLRYRADPLVLTGAAGLGAVPGPTTAPDSHGWVVARLALLPPFGAALVAIGWFTRHFDGPWTAFSRPGKVAAGTAAALFAAYALGVV